MVYYNLNSTYDDYLKDNIEKPVDIKTYLKLNYLYFKFLFKKVLDGYEVTLPNKIGTLSIKGKKIKVTYDDQGRPKNLAPNWKATKELWERNEHAKLNKKIVWYTNDETDNIRYKYFWSKKRAMMGNKLLYSLTITRANKKALVKKIKEEGKEYVLDSYGK